jgi:hypothetical protein
MHRCQQNTEMHNGVSRARAYFAAKQWYRVTIGIGPEFLESRVRARVELLKSHVSPGRLVTRCGSGTDAYQAADWCDLL